MGSKPDAVLVAKMKNNCENKFVTSSPSNVKVIG